MKAALRKGKRRSIRFLERYDWLWSIPLSVFLYWFVGFFFGSALGLAVGNFDLSFIQPLFLAVTVAIGASTCAIYAFRFHWKALYKFVYSSRTADETLSSVAAFRSLPAWQKIATVLFLFSLYFGAVVVVYLAIL